MPGIEGSRLQLEVSETIASANPELTCSVLAQLNRLEVGTVIDDFGTGRVRLMDLRRFLVDTFKIDRSLINNLLADRVSHDAVDLILTLATKLNKKVVAEGIEKAAQVDRLKALGCKFGQGYFFSQPLEVTQADELIREQESVGKHDGYSRLTHRPASLSPRLIQEQVTIAHLILTSFG